jgi:hypothetical protein
MQIKSIGIDLGKTTFHLISLGVWTGPLLKSQNLQAEEVWQGPSALGLHGDIIWTTVNVGLF